MQIFRQCQSFSAGKSFEAPRVHYSFKSHREGALKKALFQAAY
jgi:hypothetical protein